MKQIFFFRYHTNKLYTIFLKYIFNVHRKSAYSKVKNAIEPLMNFGVVHIGEKDFFNIIIKPGKPWETG